MSPARLDLAAEWRSRRWRRLLNVIDQLPRDSKFFEAVAEDDELAEQVASQPDPDRERQRRRRMADWSPAVELLTAILDRIGELTQAVAVLGGARPRNVPRAPHPVTAVDRARRKQREVRHRNLVTRVLPRPPST